jgi:DNA polymerase-1
MSVDEFISRAVAFDTETALLLPGLLAPPLVCGSCASKTAPHGELLGADLAMKEFGTLLRGNEIIVGANIAYDVGVMAAEVFRLRPETETADVMSEVFAKYDRDEVYDVQIAEALNAIAGGHLFVDPRTGKQMRGRYSLAACVDFVLGRTDAKINDYWRMRYAILGRVPMAEWPTEARQYPVDDVVNTLEVAVAQYAVARSSNTCGC